MSRDLPPLPPASRRENFPRRSAARPAAASTLRLMLVDDHAVVRAGYRRLLELESDVAVVAECADGDAAYAWLQRGQAPEAELVVLDLSMPGRSGLELLRRIAQRWPALKLLVFSMHDSPAMVAQALRAGAAGYVTKTCDPETLVRCLRQVAAGARGVLSPDIAVPTTEQPAPPHDALSVREFQVLQGLLGGESLEQIAQRLHLSAKTVSNLQTLVRQKLGVANAMELLHYARRHRLLDEPSTGGG